MKIYFKHTPLVDYSVRLMQSIKADGHEVIIKNSFDEIPDDAECAAAWGIVNAKRLMDKGVKNVLVLERGYLDQRQNWLSLGWNGLNGHANFNNEYVSSDRWKKHWKHGMNPWITRDNKNVLLCGQVLHDKTISDCEDYNKWLNDTIIGLTERGYVVTFRPHPLEKNYEIIVPHNRSTISDFHVDLSRASAIVTWSSTIACQAVYHGVPAVTFSKYSMAYDVTSHSLDDLRYMPDREAWGIRLAYTMWNSNDLLDGSAWNFVYTHLINFMLEQNCKII